MRRTIKTSRYLLDDTSVDYYSVPYDYDWAVFGEECSTYTPMLKVRKLLRESDPLYAANCCD